MGSKKRYYKVSIILLLIMILSLLISCDKSSTGSDDDGVNLQRSVEWPSLADSPWPVYRHDPQNTGRSEYPGALNGTLVRKISSHNSEAGVIIGKDSLMFYINSKSGDFYLCAAEYSGDIKWMKKVYRETPTNPAVLYDGSIVSIGLEKGELIRLSASGDTLWQCFLGDYSYGLWAASPGIAVGLDTSLYIVDFIPSLKKVNSDGELVWVFQDERISTLYDNFPVFSPDGGTIYLDGIDDVTLIAVNVESGDIEWTYGNIPMTNSPAVDNEGNIYIFNGDPAVPYQSSESWNYHFISLRSDGSVRWKYPIKKRRTLCYRLEPVIDWNGNVYFAKDSLFSFTNDGKLRWKINVNNNIPAVGLVCDQNNNIYYIASNNNGCLEVYCISSKGKIIWEYIDNNEYTRLSSTPVIFKDSLIIPGWRSEWVYIIK